MPRPFVILFGLAACLACHAAPVTEALQRPALAVREPGRAVLLAAAQAGERIVAVGERGVIAVSDDRGAHWRQAPSPVSVTLTMVRFADAKNGVAVGHGGTVVSSTDGGARWTRGLDARRAAQMAAAAARTADEQREAERLVAVISAPRTSCSASPRSDRTSSLRPGTGARVRISLWIRTPSGTPSWNVVAKVVAKGVPARTHSSPRRCRKNSTASPNLG